MLCSDSGKGSARRKEDLKKVSSNLDKVDWSKKTEGKRDFKIRINGKLVNNG